MFLSPGRHSHTTIPVNARSSSSRVAWAAVALLPVLLASACGGEPPGPAPISPQGGSTSGRTLGGTITDYARRPLEGALVEVLNGPSRGTTMRTNASGRYSFQVASSTEAMAIAIAAVRVSRAGYHTKTLSFSQWIALESVEPPIGLQPGLYTVTVSFDPATAGDVGNHKCAGFPADLVSTSYQMRIEALTGHVQNRFVRRDDPRLNEYSGFGLGVSGPFVGFSADGPDSGGGFFAEFPELRYLDVMGWEAGTSPAVANGASVSVRFKGTFGSCQLTSAPAASCWEAQDRVVHACKSDSATMVFTPR